MPSASKQNLCFEGYTLDLARGCLRCGERDIELRPKSFEVLRRLVENAGWLMSKDELIGAVWPNMAASDESLVHCVSELRLALGDGDQRFIKTVPRRGYLFAAVVSNEARPGGRLPPVRTEPAPRPRLSIAVLPLANLSAAASQDYLVDAITDTLTTDLARIPGIFVIARGAAAAFKDKAIDPRAVGRELGVRYVLEGSVLSGDGIRVNAQLIDTETGAHVWAERFDKPRGDVLVMQDEISGRLARTLGIELILVESRRIERESPDSADPVDLAIRGWAVLNRPMSRNRARQARDLFDAALRVNDSQVDALLGLAASHLYEAGNFLADQPAEHIRIADVAIAKALSLAPENASAHNVFATLLGALGRPERALRECELALTLDRNLASAHARAGLMKLYLGRAEEMEAHVAKAINLSPRDPELRLWYLFAGAADLLLDRLDQAINHLRKSIEVDPDFELPYFYLAAALALSGRGAEATEARAAGEGRAPNLTIAKFRAQTRAQHPVHLAQRERIYRGMRRAGVREE